MNERLLKQKHWQCGVLLLLIGVQVPKKDAFIFGWHWNSSVMNMFLCVRSGLGWKDKFVSMPHRSTGWNHRWDTANQFCHIRPHSGRHVC